MVGKLIQRGDAEAERGMPRLEQQGTFQFLLFSSFRPSRQANCNVRIDRREIQAASVLFFFYLENTERFVLITHNAVTAF